MNLEADGEITRVSENQSHPCIKTNAVAQSPFDLIASFLSRRWIASASPGNKKRFVGDIFIGVLGACRTDFRRLASTHLPDEPECAASYGVPGFAQVLSKRLEQKPSIEVTRRKRRAGLQAVKEVFYVNSSKSSFQFEDKYNNGSLKKIA